MISPRGRQLTDVQRACDKAINSIRAAVERSIAHLVNRKVLDTGWSGRLTAPKYYAPSPASKSTPHGDKQAE